MDIYRLCTVQHYGMCKYHCYLIFLILFLKIEICNSYSTVILVQIKGIKKKSTSKNKYKSGENYKTDCEEEEKKSP